MAREQIKGDQLADAIIERGNRLGGLTIRARFAESAMNGILSNSGIDSLRPEQVSSDAVRHADALIEALNAGEKEQ